MAQSLRAQIMKWAQEAGFEAAGISRPDGAGSAGRQLHRFLDQNYHGNMGWMSEHRLRRADPLVLWPECRSVIVLGLNYAPDYNPLDDLQKTDTGLISVYARRKDYHSIVKKKLKRVAGQIAHETGLQVKVFVDTAPVMEKPLARAAGLGWQGKHTSLISRDYGNWMFLGEIFTEAEIEPDQPGQDHCGNCQKCLEICPTHAFPAPYQLDARRCISYLTIEHKGHIDPELRPLMGNRIFGCDDCLAVCPWNKFAQRARTETLKLRHELAGLPLKRLAGLDDAGFRTLFAGTPVKRAGRDGFVRNVLIAIGNSADKALASAARDRINDASPYVRAMAIWALGRLMDAKAFAALAREYAGLENDPDVKNEWVQAVSPGDKLPD